MENKKICQRNEIDNKYKWNLEKIYKSEKKLNDDINYVKKATRKLLKYKNKILDNSSNLYDSTFLYFSIVRTIEKLSVYADMKLHENMSFSKSQILVGTIDKLSDDIFSKLSFYSPELLKGDYSTIELYIKENKKLEEYSFSFKDLFREKNHVLDALQEEFIAKLGEVFDSSSNTFDILDTVDLSFADVKDSDGNDYSLNQSNFSVYIRSNDRILRKNTFNSYYNSYLKHKNTYASTLIGNMKKELFISSIRKYESPLEMALFSDNITVSFYESLIEKINKRLDISHKYISFRKKVLKLKDMHMYDIYAPLTNELDLNFSYEEAIDLVKKALSPLGNNYIQNLSEIIDSNCIDVFHNDNKKTGAYSWGSYDTLPYVLLNYEGTFNDVSTLAHELGHSMHSYYSKTNNTYCDSSYSIFLAEIASTVNEILLNKYCSEHAKSKEEKLFYLNNLLESIRTTFIRQAMFAEFEKKLYDESLKGKILTEETISSYYYKLNKKYYGKDIIFDKKIEIEWARISHFYSGFYVYQYATGIAIACKIVKEIINKKSDTLNKYLELLKSGGKDYPLNLLKKVGIDIENDDTIDEVLNFFDETINEYERTMN